MRRILILAIVCCWAIDTPGPSRGQNNYPGGPPGRGKIPPAPITLPSNSLVDGDLIGNWTLQARQVKFPYVFANDGTGTITINGEVEKFVWCLQKGTPWEGKLVYLTKIPSPQRVPVNAQPHYELFPTLFRVVDKKTLVRREQVSGDEIIEVRLTKND